MARPHDPLPPIDFARLAASADLPRLIEAEGIEVRRGLAFCPFHDNTVTPALSVYHRGDRWRFKCHGCPAAGDALDWLMLRGNLTRPQAARTLDPSLVIAGDRPAARSARPAASPSPDPAPVARPARPAKLELWRDPRWQDRVTGLVRQAEARLWSRAGRDALRWLRDRGLEDHTIRRFRLGFVAAGTRTDPVEGLLDDAGRPRGLFAPRGITIPWLAPGAWYGEGNGEPEGPRWVGLNVRRLVDDVAAKLPEGVPKYQAVRGSVRGFLYPFPDVERTQGRLPILLVEGEFDALVGVQEAGHLLHVATAGSASASVRDLPRATRAALARCTTILLLPDRDRPGLEAARAWREAYPHKSRVAPLPHGKDLGEFFAAGGEVASLARAAALHH